MRSAIVVVALAVLLAAAAWVGGGPPAAYAGAWLSSPGMNQLADQWSDLVVQIKKNKNKKNNNKKNKHDDDDGDTADQGGGNTNNQGGGANKQGSGDTSKPSGDAANTQGSGNASGYVQKPVSICKSEISDASHDAFRENCESFYGGTTYCKFEAEPGKATCCCKSDVTKGQGPASTTSMGSRKHGF